MKESFMKEKSRVSSLVSVTKISNRHFETKLNKRAAEMEARREDSVSNTYTERDSSGGKIFERDSK